jgi:hypothetical protein
MEEVFGSYDVLVVGGGTEGVSAAIASARAGANTLLIERLGALGGQMNVQGPPGFAYAHMFNPRGEQVIGGIVEETHNRLLKEGHALPHLKPAWRAGYTFSYVDPDWWGLLMFEMMTENNVNLLLHSLVVDVVRDGKTIKGVVVENTSGRQIVLGKVIIDCTGEGDLCVKAGVPFEKRAREHLMRPSIAFTVDGVNWEVILKYIKENPNEFAFRTHPYLKMSQEEMWKQIKAIKKIEEIGNVPDGWFSIVDKGVKAGEMHQFGTIGFFLTPREGGVIQAHFQHSAHVPDCDATDIRDLTRAEVEARHQAIMAWKFIKKHIPGFEKAYITRVTPEIRIRETRRITCDYRITEKDIAAARKFKDVIGKDQYQAGGQHMKMSTMLDPDAIFARDGGSTDIPYRSLVPVNVEGLLVAGKPICTDETTYKRFIVSTMVTGQAAGVAAAVCAKKGITPRELEKDVKEVQDILIKQGAILFGTH